MLFRSMVLMFGVLSAGFAKPSLKSTPQKPVSFLNDVIPALTRAGCNQGACHGAAIGKGGFKLSLRGFAPEIDHLAIVHLAKGRRINLLAPEKSLFLQKPLLELPHIGGKALKKGTQEYTILLRWLLQGAPTPDPKDAHVVALQVTPAVQSLAVKANVQLRVDALFSDGSKREIGRAHV